MNYTTAPERTPSIPVITRVTSRTGPITKHISLGADGQIVKDASGCLLTDGEAERVSLRSPFAALANTLRTLKPEQALIHGDFTAEPDKVQILSEARRADTPGAISRTKEHFRFPGGPGSFFFDYDYDSRMGGTLDRREYWAALCEVWEGFKEAGYVWRPSTSAHITNNETGATVGESANQRFYCFARDAQDLPRFADVLFKRLWLAGRGYIFITRDGRMLPRTIFDRAVFSPERLDFCAGAVCDPPLVQRLPAPHVHRGGFIDTRTLPDLTAEEEARFQSLIDEAKANAQAEADRIREAYTGAEIRRLVEKGMPAARADMIVKERIGGDLIGADVLRFDRFGAVTVGDVLQDLAKFHNATLADPIEPEYGGGSGKAKLFANFGNGTAKVHSFAHGGRSFTLWHDFQSLKASLKRAHQHDEDEFQYLFADAIARAKLTPMEVGRIIDDTKARTGINKPLIQAEIDRARARLNDEAESELLTHNDMAARWLKAQGHPEPIGADGMLWQYKAECWQGLTLPKLEPAIAEMFNSQPRCAKKADYRAIAQHVYDVAEQFDFFEGAPVGVACPSGFYRLEDGEIVRQALTPEHRQRFILPVDPEDGEPQAFLEFLTNCFRDPRGAPAAEAVRVPAQACYDEEGQIALVQEIMGGVLLGVMHTFEKVALFYGEGSAGKSTLLRIIEALIPEQYRDACDPFKWGQEYYIASLAGKRLNSVGELPDNEYIPGNAFKKVTGRDTLQGRHPTHRPFTFRCSAAHLFNSNSFINTRDQSTGFWRRWLVLGFFNTHQRGEEVRDLDQQIIDSELGRIINWALRGGLRLVQRNGFTETKVHRELMARWRRHTDSVEEFLADPEAILIRDGANAPRSQVYTRYTQWCRDNGRRPLSKGRFVDRIAGRGFRVKKLDGVFVYEGMGIPGAVPDLAGLSADYVFT